MRFRVCLVGVLLVTVAPAGFAQSEAYGAYGTAAPGVTTFGEGVGYGVVTEGTCTREDTSTGVATLTFYGGFQNLAGPHTVTRIHYDESGDGGPPRPIIYTPRPTLDAGEEDQRGAYAPNQPTAGDNVFCMSATELAQLRDGSYYYEVHSEAYPMGELRGFLHRVPEVDGDLSDAQYSTLAADEDANAGFGPGVDLTAIRIYYDPMDEVLFVGLVGFLDPATDAGFGLWLDLDALTGRAAGTALGVAGARAAHYMNGSNGADTRFAADFEVDYMFSLRPAGRSAVFLDVVRFGGPVEASADAVGFATQDGLPQLGPLDGVDNTGDAPVFTRDRVVFAFDNAGTGSTGLEMAIPLRELLGQDEGEQSPAPLAAAPPPTLTAFAFVADGAGRFSDVTIPGTVPSGNPGVNPDFSTLDGGPYNASTGVLPVELVAFEARLDGQRVTLTWETASETANAGFAVEQRRPDALDYAEVAFVPGAGTTTGPTVYTHTLDGLEPGRHAFRLRQVDLDGSIDFSPSVEVDVGLSTAHLLSAPHPNPASGTARFSIGVQRAQAVTVAVFDVTGRRVATVWDGPLEADRVLPLEVATTGLAAGVYLLRAQGESFVETRRFTVVR